jgi:hypothetical protein
MFQGGSCACPISLGMIMTPARILIPNHRCQQDWCLCCVFHHAIGVHVVLDIVIVQKVFLNLDMLATAVEKLIGSLLKLATSAVKEALDTATLPIEAEDGKASAQTLSGLSPFLLSLVFRSCLLR